MLGYFNSFCLIVFSVEAALRIVALGLYRGKGTYLKDPWNMFDFFTLCVSWLVYMIYQAGWAEVFGISEATAFIVSV